MRDVALPAVILMVCGILAWLFHTNTDLANIGEAMKYAGTGMAGLGVSVEQTTAMIGVRPCL